MRRDTLDALLRPRERSRPLVLATDLETGVERVIFPFDPGEADGDPVVAAARDATADDRSTIVETDGRRIFLHVFNPPVRVVVVGAVHIAQQLAAMTESAGYEVVVVDPRRDFATAERFPGVVMVRAWPEEAFADLGLDRRTAVVTVTHDPKLDDPALRAALASDVFYVGALGSRRTHAARLERLREDGLGEQSLARIHAPVGLDIGARTPGEIAASVLGEIVRTLRSPGK